MLSGQSLVNSIPVWADTILQQDNVKWMIPLHFWAGHPSLSVTPVGTLLHGSQVRQDTVPPHTLSLRSFLSSKALRCAKLLFRKSWGSSIGGCRISEAGAAGDGKPLSKVLCKSNILS